MNTNDKECTNQDCDHYHCLDIRKNLLPPPVIKKGMLSPDLPLRPNAVWIIEEDRMTGQEWYERFEKELDRKVPFVYSRSHAKKVAKRASGIEESKKNM